MSNEQLHPTFQAILGAIDPTINTVRVKEVDFYKMPANVQEMCRVYAMRGYAIVDGADLVFQFPTYRTQEILAALAKCLPPAPGAQENRS